MPGPSAQSIAEFVERDAGNKSPIDRIGRDLGQARERLGNPQDAGPEVSPGIGHRV